MGRITNMLGMLVIAGLVVAVLRQFDWDPFAAAEWILSWIWDAINRVADIWSSNDTFREVTEKP